MGVLWRDIQIFLIQISQGLNVILNLVEKEGV